MFYGTNKSQTHLSEQEEGRILSQIWEGAEFSSQAEPRHRFPIFIIFSLLISAFTI